MGRECAAATLKRNSDAVFCGMWGSEQDEQAHWRHAHAPAVGMSTCMASVTQRTYGEPHTAECALYITPQHTNRYLEEKRTCFFLTVLNYFYEAYEKTFIPRNFWKLAYFYDWKDLKNLPYVKTGFPFSCGLRVKWNRKIVTTVAITANTLRIYMCQALCEVPLYVHFLIQTSTTFCGRSCYPHFTEGETEAEKS